jgi:hypothetical protein
MNSAGKEQRPSGRDLMRVIFLSLLGPVTLSILGPLTLHYRREIISFCHKMKNSVLAGCTRNREYLTTTQTGWGR